MTKGIEHYSVGDAFDDFMLIKSASRGVASNGKPFLTLILRDVSGEIEAKLWDTTKEDENTFVPEQIARIAGEVNQFRGKPQLKIFSIRLSRLEDGVQVDDFIEKAPVTPQALTDQLTEAIFEMTNASLQRIVRAVVKKYQQHFLTYPAAAKHHHAYASGLAHHTVSMLQVAKKLHELYPETNKDLLYAGVILHDLGKVKELSGVVTTSYTLAGKLVGHIPMLVEEIGHTANELQIDGEEVLILQHLVLSHHGKPEWGSPKMPLIREAELLHLIDLIDARMNTLNRALDRVSPGEFTERLFGLDNRAFYKPAFDEK